MTDVLELLAGDTAGFGLGDMGQGFYIHLGRVNEGVTDTTEIAVYWRHVGEVVIVTAAVGRGRGWD